MTNAKRLDRATRGKAGQRVRDARKARGWTQVDLADEVGVSITWVRQLERGSETWPGKNKRIFRAEAGTLLRVAEALYPYLNAAELLGAWGHDPSEADGVIEYLRSEMDRSSSPPGRRRRGTPRVEVSRHREIARLYGCSDRVARQVDEVIQVIIRWDD